MIRSDMVSLVIKSLTIQYNMYIVYPYLSGSILKNVWLLVYATINTETLPSQVWIKNKNRLAMKNTYDNAIFTISVLVNISKNWWLVHF